MDRHLLFFYGTLMSRDCRGHVLRQRPTDRGVIDLAEPVADGTIRGNLHDVGHGSFPAFCAGDGEIHGEVWEAPTHAHLCAALGVTDRIEGYDPLRWATMYHRVEVPLLTVDGAELEPGDTVLTYRWNGPPPGALIADGRWQPMRRGAFA